MGQNFLDMQFHHYHENHFKNIKLISIVLFVIIKLMIVIKYYDLIE